MSLRPVSKRFFAGLAVTALMFTLSTFAADNQKQDSVLSGGDGTSPSIGSSEPAVDILEESVALTGLAFRVPDTVDVQNPLVVTVSVGKKSVAKETIVLPAKPSSASGVVSQFLGNHPEELQRIREMDEARPGLLRFNVTTGGENLIDIPFGEAASAGMELAVTTQYVLGQSHEVDVHLREPRKITAQGMVPEPECEAACSATYVECYYEICDQRGDCSYCWNDYLYCANSCPQVCVEPKQTYTWKTSWTPWSTTLQEWCKMPGAAKYVFKTTIQRRTVYKRTVHCDGTYTDTYQGTEQQQVVCKVYVGGPCGFAPIWTTGLPPTCSF